MKKLKLKTLDKRDDDGDTNVDDDILSNDADSKFDVPRRSDNFRFSRSLVRLNTYLDLFNERANSIR